MTARAAIASPAALLATALLSAAAGADPFPARPGTSGLLDVADARALDFGAAALGVELRLDLAPKSPRALGPSPVTMAFGLGHGLEVALGLREGGLPGDPRPSPLLFTGAVKLRFFEETGRVPGVALLASVDRINLGPQGALELVLSKELGGRVRLAATGGVEDLRGLGSTSVGPRGGGAVGLRGPHGTELVLEALGHPGGAQLGAALRWALRDEAGVALGVQWQPGDGGVRISLGFGLSSAPPQRPRQQADEEVAVAAPIEQKPGARVFKDPLPHLRLKVKPERMPGEDGNRHLQSGPQGEAPAVAPSAPAAPPLAPAPPAAHERAPAKPARKLTKREEPRAGHSQCAPAATPLLRPGTEAAWLTPPMARQLDNCACPPHGKWAAPSKKSTLVLIVGPDGRVQRSAFVQDSRRTLPPYEACLRAAVLGWSLPATGAVQVLWLDLPRLQP